MRTDYLYLTILVSASLNSVSFRGNVWETFKETAQKLGNLYRMHVLGTVYIVISDPAIAKQVITSPGTEQPSRSNLMNSAF